MVRIGYIGAGGNGTGHMRRLHELEHAEIVAVCDLVEERAEKAANDFGAVKYLDHRQMLDKEELDAVYVSIPCDAHGQVELDIIEKGCHLLVEKPVVLNVEMGVRIAEAIEAKGLISAVGYQLRYLHNVERMKAFLTGKTVGLANVVRWGGIPGTPWWRVMAESGGQLHEQTTHQLDLLRHFLGDVVSVKANYSLRVLADEENFTVPDMQTALFEFEDGTLATLSTSPMAGRAGKSMMEFLLRDQRIEFGFSGPIRSIPDPVPELEGDPEERPSIDWHFVEAVRTGNPSLIRSSYRDGLKTASVTLAANEAAETGMTVTPFFARA